MRELYKVGAAGTRVIRPRSSFRCPDVFGSRAPLGESRRSLGATVVRRVTAGDLGPACRRCFMPDPNADQIIAHSLNVSRLRLDRARERIGKFIIDPPLA